MSNQEIIPVALRTGVGKSASRKLRKQGMIPATIYGLGEPAVSVSISPKVVARVLASETGMNSMIRLQREGTDIQRHVIIKELQRDPVTGRLSHVDFMRVDPTHKVRIHVPIVLKGTAAGVKEGGMVDFVHRSIEVECLPTHIPGHIDIDVSHLLVNDFIRLDQVKLDAHLTLIGDPHNVICHVQPKKAEEEVVAVVPVVEVPEPQAVETKGRKEDKREEKREDKREEKREEKK
jgi:large subunit ribosomal protein L25